MATGWSRISIAASLGLAACATPRTEAPVPASTPPVAAATRAAGVLGSTAAALAARFGDPALVVLEGPARKLQFNEPACVLDLYLYAPHEGAEPVVTHADARGPDGVDTAVESCVEALETGSPQ